MYIYTNPCNRININLVSVLIKCLKLNASKLVNQSKAGDKARDKSLVPLIRIMRNLKMKNIVKDL